MVLASERFTKPKIANKAPIGNVNISNQSSNEFASGPSRNKFRWGSCLKKAAKIGETAIAPPSSSKKSPVLDLVFDFSAGVALAIDLYRSQPPIMAASEITTGEKM